MHYTAVLEDPGSIPMPKTILMFACSLDVVVSFALLFHLVTLT